ncbi:5'-3' exoribonuclease [Gracilaria domingensis]|nr:5'-3' exoribonuclease [Gracilaria domingensis]
MFARIFEYTERLFRIVAPRKLMLLAVDGVAPRAKMNQQRSRRFRSAKDAERAMADAIARGDQIPDGKPFDSNCITPGTEFMFELSRRFREWIHHKMSSEPAWQQGCTVIFSGSEAPGEGEHKIMDFIRNWKKSPRYDPQTRHCMYGLDADLMMLGLVAHAPHFTLLREKMRYKKSRRKVPVMTGSKTDADEFQLLEIALLRDMLFLEFKRDDAIEPWTRARGRRRPSQLEKNALKATFPDGEPASSGSAKQKNHGFEYDSRRIVDDFVFMCMLVGNDFLPNVPHLDIAEGAINLMFRIYKHMLPSWGGYLTQSHKLHPDRLESFLEKVSQSEMQYFEHRCETDGVPEYNSVEYRQKYYELKFQFDVEGKDGQDRVKNLRRIYMEGLHWVLQYYHNGVPSWNWFYPHFYTMLASDMKSLRAIKVAFKKGRPFKPLTQLMAVLPPESAELLPAPMQELMINPGSPVAKFYPLEFDVDQNGKRNAWEAVVVVPFIEEESLLREINAIDKEKEFTKTEKERDRMGPENWFHARDYPRSQLRILPVRPSKYYIPQRSRSPSPTGSWSRSSSPRRYSPPRGVSPRRQVTASGGSEQTKKPHTKPSGKAGPVEKTRPIDGRSPSSPSVSPSRTKGPGSREVRRSSSPSGISAKKGRSAKPRNHLDPTHHHDKAPSHETHNPPSNSPGSLKRARRWNVKKPTEPRPGE